MPTRPVVSRRDFLCVGAVVTLAPAALALESTAGGVPVTATVSRPVPDRARTASAAVIVDTTRSPHAKLRPVAVGAVKLRDQFLQPRREINRRATIPSQHEHCEKTSRIDNFRRAAGRIDKPFVGIYFNDSDVYKWLEAAAWELAADDDAGLRGLVEQVVEEIGAAQQPDGYLNTYFMFDLAKERWTNLKDKHEMYCAGHLIQGAVAHARATPGPEGERFLAVARRLADHIDSVFGPPEAGKRPGACGHPECEMALVELARLTGEERYLRLAEHMIDVRGHRHLGGNSYHQDHVPYRELRDVTGHAVRMIYLACGAADVVLETGDSTLREALEAQWQNMTERRMYVTGGLGARWEGEAFGKDYELPNERAYAETCAAIASVMWNWRMLLLTGEARFADLMEWTLYNAVLPGLSLDGQSYFYQNPLADQGQHRRQEWFGCACCPPNVARMLAQLPGYFYSVDDRGVWVHLYAEGDAELTLPDGREVTLRQQTGYPWDGKVRIEVGTPGRFAVRVRVPAWCEGATVAVEGAKPQAAKSGDYVTVERQWKGGEVIELDLPMPVRRVEAHPHVMEDQGKVALTRGPLVYCVEGMDHPGVDVRDLVLPDAAELRTTPREDLLGGVTVLEGEARVVEVGGDALYFGAKPQALQGRRVTMTAVPYYAWANREAGRMLVWLRRG